MNRNDMQEVEKIVQLWRSYAEKNNFIDSAAAQSSTILQKLVEHHGELPQSSGYQPETVTARVDLIKGIRITDDERRARRIIMSLPVRLRVVLVKWVMVRKQHNAGTGRPWVQHDIARELEMTDEQYLDLRGRVCAYVLGIWRVKKTAPNSLYKNTACT